MIVKIMSNKGQAHYISAEEFTIHKIDVSNIYKDFKLSYKESEIGYYQDRNRVISDKINSEVKLQTNQVTRFMVDCEFEALGLICHIHPTTRGKEQETIVTNQNTFLMSDDGKTIERLI